MPRPPAPIPVAKKFDPKSLETYFVNPITLEWRIKNNSDLVAEDASIYFVIIDLNRPGLDPIATTPGYTLKPQMYAPIASATHPLAIPYINPHGKSGAIVFPIDVLRQIKKGDLLFGVAQVGCKWCQTRRYYVWLKVGQEGWFSEFSDADMNLRAIDFPAATNKRKMEEIVPIERRVPILAESN